MLRILLIFLLTPSLVFACATPEHPLVCKVAEIRLEQIKSEWSHKGFLDKEANRSVRIKAYNDLGHTWENYLPKGMWRENLARGFTDRKKVYDAWQKSPTHRANLEATSTYSCLRFSDGYWVLIMYHMSLGETSKALI